MEQHLKVTPESEDLEPGHVRLRLRGQFTWLHGKQFKMEIDRALRSGLPHIELDIRDLSYLDSTALSEILSAKNLADEAGGKVWISNPRKLIRHIFVSANLDKALEIGPVYDPKQDESED